MEQRNQLPNQPNNEAQTKEKEDPVSYFRLPIMLFILGVIMTLFSLMIAYLGAWARVAYWLNPTFWLGPVFILPGVVLYAIRIDIVKEHPENTLATRFEARVTKAMLITGIAIILLLTVDLFKLYLKSFSGGDGGFVSQINRAQLANTTDSLAI